MAVNPGTDALGSGEARGAELGRALVLFLVAAVWLGRRADAIVQADVSRDLAFAQDLIEGTQLHGHGAWSGFAGLLQGTTWINLLALAQLGGLGIAGIERALTVLLAATVAFAGVAFARMLPAASPAPDDLAFAQTRRRLAATVGALVVLALLPWGIEVPLLWQPILLPAPILLAHLCLWRVLRHGELVDVAALAVSCALAFDVHLVSLAVIGLALVAVPLASQRPLAAVAIGLGLGLTTTMISSPELLPANLERLADLGLLVPTALATAAALGLGLGLRGRFAALAWETRLRLALGVELLALAVVVAASLLDATPHFAGRYLLPFLPAIGLAAALATDRVRSRASLTTAGLAALLLLLASWPGLRVDARTELPANPVWGAADFDRVAARLRARGLTWTEAALRLQGPRSSTLLSQLAARLEAGASDPGRPESGLLVLAYTPGDVDSILAELGDASVEVVELDDVRALIVETSARIDRAAAELCRDDSRDCTSVTLTATARVAQAHPSTWVGRDRAQQWLEADGRPARDDQLWRLPVDPGPAAVLGFSGVLPPACAWQIVAVEGFEPRESLPTRQLELRPDVAGAVLVSRRTAGEGCEEISAWPPSTIETAPGWDQLRISLEPKPD